MNLFLTLLAYEWRSLQRQAYNWVLPLSFFICAATLFLWIPQQGIEGAAHQASLWITLFFALTLTTKDVFLSQTQQSTLTLWHELKIPTLYIFWSKWLTLSVLCLICFMPPLLFLGSIGGKSYISPFHLGQIAPLSIALFTLINLSVSCLFAKKSKKNSPFLAPILSIPLSIPALLLTIQATLTPIFSSSFFFLLALFLFLFPIFSLISSLSLATLKKG
ncbi:MAG: hypothetical protein GY915_02825 [bacterium]|nr:hypothetical protein [bacterium]